MKKHRKFILHVKIAYHTQIAFDVRACHELDPRSFVKFLSMSYFVIENDHFFSKNKGNLKRKMTLLHVTIRPNIHR